MLRSDEPECSEYGEKVKKEQTKRVILNLIDSEVDMTVLWRQLEGYLKEEIVFLKDGHTTHFYP